MVSCFHCFFPFLQGFFSVRSVYNKTKIVILMVMIMTIVSHFISLLSTTQISHYFEACTVCCSLFEFMQQTVVFGCVCNLLHFWPHNNHFHFDFRKTRVFCSALWKMCVPTVYNENRMEWTDFLPLAHFMRRLMVLQANCAHYHFFPLLSRLFPRPYRSLSLVA